MSGALPPSGSIHDLRTDALGTIGQRLAALDLTQLFVYVIKNVPDSALPFLAWQFDVLSPFWQLEAPGATQRSLIQQAIPLHSTLGTPAAIMTAIGNLGWFNPVILEGQASWGSKALPTSQGWAVFRVLVPKADVNGLSVTVSLTQALQVLDAVLFFKPARSVLDSLWFVEPPIIEQPIPMTDNIALTVGNIVIEPTMVLSDLPTVVGWAIKDTWSAVATLNATYYIAAGFTLNTVGPFIASGPLIVNGTVIASN